MQLAVLAKGWCWWHWEEIVLFFLVRNRSHSRSSGRRTKSTVVVWTYDTLDSALFRVLG